MHMQQPLRPRPLMQIIDILRDDEQLARPFRIEPRDRAMGSVGLDLGQPRPPRVIKFVHQRGIANERLGRRDILDPMPLPQAVRRPERSQPALCANPRAGQDDDIAVRHF